MNYVLEGNLLNSMVECLKTLLGSESDIDRLIQDLGRLANLHSPGGRPGVGELEWRTSQTKPVILQVRCRFRSWTRVDQLVYFVLSFSEGKPHWMRVEAPSGQRSKAPVKRVRRIPRIR